MSQLLSYVSSRSTKSTTSLSTKSTQIAPANFYSVHKVSDGDTATLKNFSDNNKEVRVRFLCIDAPEKSQDRWGAESLKKLNELLPVGSKVSLIVANQDLYGRTVGEIINNKGININRKMVELGLAIYYPFQKGCTEYKDLEKTAKQSKLGVWSDKNFEFPWDYRKRMGIGMRGQHNNKNPKDKITNSITATSKAFSMKSKAQKRSNHAASVTTTTLATYQKQSSKASPKYSAKDSPKFLYSSSTSTSTKSFKPHSRSTTLKASSTSKSKRT